MSQTEKVVTNVSRKWGGYTGIYGLQFLAGDFEIGSERGDSSLLFLEGALTKAQSDQPTFARRGYSYTLSARLHSRRRIDRYSPGLGDARGEMAARVRYGYAPDPAWRGGQDEGR